VKLFILAAALLSACAPLLLAHHSFTAEYRSNLITLKGKIIRFVWMNPHTRIYLNVPDARGTVTRWECEGSAPGGLAHNGWDKDSLKPGDYVTIEGFPARDHLNVCKARAVTLANGRHLFMGSTGAQ